MPGRRRVPGLGKIRFPLGLKHYAAKEAGSRLGSVSFQTIDATLAHRRFGRRRGAHGFYGARLIFSVWPAERNGADPRIQARPRPESRYIRRTTVRSPRGEDVGRPHDAGGGLGAAPPLHARGARDGGRYPSLRLPARRKNRVSKQPRLSWAACTALKAIVAQNSSWGP